MDNKTPKQAIKDILWPFPVRGWNSLMFILCWIIWIIPLLLSANVIIRCIYGLDSFSSSFMAILDLIGVSALAVALGFVYSYFEPAITAIVKNAAHRPSALVIEDGAPIFTDPKIESAMNELIMGAGPCSINTVQARAIMEAIYTKKDYLISGVEKISICQWLFQKTDVLKNVSSPKAILNARQSKIYDEKYYPIWKRNVYECIDKVIKEV